MTESPDRTPVVTRRREVLDVLAHEPRTLHELAAALGMKLSEVEEHLRHLERSARNESWQLVVEPARCRQCDFRFAGDRLKKPGKCPRCRGRRISAPRIGVEGLP